MRSTTKRRLAQCAHVNGAAQVARPYRTFPPGTIFTFAKEAGIMGEAGPDARMPLSRSAGSAS